MVDENKVEDTQSSASRYVTQRVNVPTELPIILKQYTKALIKTQPPNYIAWSAAYFQALSENRPLPIKPRLEAADGNNLTIGLLEIIIDQIGKTTGTISLAVIESRWTDLGLAEIDLADTLIRAKLINDLSDIQEDPAMKIDIQQFIAAASMQISSKDDLVGCMDIVCQLLAADPADRYHGTRFDIFSKLYKFLAKISDVEQDTQNKALRYLGAKAEANQGLLLPGAMFAETCPALTSTD